MIYFVAYILGAWATLAFFLLTTEPWAWQRGDGRNDVLASLVWPLTWVAFLCVGIWAFIVMPRTRERMLR